MIADAPLHEAYQEWQRLAEAEGEAIRSSNWSLLAACQHALTQLQDRITPLAEITKAEWARLGERAVAREKAVRDRLAQLIELERRNHTLLSGLCEAARSRLAELDHSRSNLKRLQRSYTSAQPAAWQSFS